MTAPLQPAVHAADDGDESAMSVLRRGIGASPDLQRGLRATVMIGLLVAAGRLVIPILIERTLDRVSVDGEIISVDLGPVLLSAAITLIIVLASAIGSWIAQRRLVWNAERAIAKLRVDAFTKVHQLSVADHNETRRGVLVARVTSDADALARFAQWGLYAWSIHPTVIVGTVAVIAWYSWVLAIVVVLAYAPVIPVLRWLQKRQLAAYDALRTSVAEMLSGFSEAVTGAAVVRAYGIEGRTKQRLHDAIAVRYGARLRANKYMAGVFVAGDLFGAIAFSLVLIFGLRFRASLGLTGGELVACLFLTSFINGPVGEIGETLDQTQTAIAGWRKILNLLDRERELIDPDPGEVVDAGPVAIEVTEVGFRYREGPPVLFDVDVSIPPGTNVAVVGETGSGKTTFAKLLCRLADPVSGTIHLNGVELRSMSAESRHNTVRMVPQDGFLFEATVGQNIRFGRPSATDADIEAAVDELGLTSWLGRLPEGLATDVGERGSFLSVGERQLVALIRAALADPGLLILDEATSSVDPETDQALTTAIRRLSEGRTVVSIAHRLATAEAADLVVVFDQGRIVQLGNHGQLVAQPGHYQRLHQAWEGNTKRAA